MKASKLGSSTEMAGRYKLRRSIVIGLGGTGRHVCTQLRRILLENFDNDPARFSHVRFLSIDIDARVRKVLTSSGETVQLRREEMLGVSIPAALDTRRLRRIMSEGTIRHLPHANEQGGMRSRPIGHAFLVTNWTRIREAIKALIRGLRGADLKNIVRTDPRFKDMDAYPIKLDLYVVGNLVSGAGSGMAVGMGYLLRDLLMELYDGVTEFRTEAIFTACGIYALGDLGGQPSPYAVNCYAALLELNHFSNPIIHKSLESAFDAGYDEVRINREARQKPPYDNVQILNPSHSAAGELSHVEFEPHIAEILALRTGSAIGMTGNAKLIGELTGWPLYDNMGNLRFCWAWGAHTFRSSSQEILDLATALAADQLLDALMGENVRTAINRKDAAWNILNAVGFGYAAEKSRQKNASLLTALLTPKEEIQNAPPGVSLVETIKELITKAFPQPSNERDLIEGLPIQLDRKKHEVAGRITGLIAAVAEHNRRLLALATRKAFEKELYQLADFSLDGHGCLDDAIGVIDLLVGPRDDVKSGLLRKDSEAYQAAAQGAMAEINRGRTSAETNESSIKSIAAMGRRVDYQALVGAWGNFVKGMIQEKVNEAKRVVLEEARKILDGDATDQNEVLRFGMIRHLESVRLHLQTARQQLKTLDERFEAKIHWLERSVKRPDAQENKILVEAHELKNQALNGEWLRLCAAETVKIIGPPHSVQTRYDTDGQIGKDYAAIDSQMRDRIRNIGASRLAASIEANPTFDGLLQSLLERSEPAVRVNPNRDTPPEIAYLSVPPDVPKFKEEVILSNWLRGRIKNKDEDELFQERADDVEPRVDVIMARLNFSPASIIGIDKLAELYARATTSAEGRRKVHTLPDPTDGEDLFFENLGETGIRVTLAYLVARCEGWLKQGESGACYEYPRAAGSLVEEPYKRDFRADLGDPAFPDEFVEPLVPESSDPAVTCPVFVHAMRRFRRDMLADDPGVRDEAFSRLLIGVAQIAKQTGELANDPLFPKPNTPEAFHSFERTLRGFLTPLGLLRDIAWYIKHIKREQVPALGDLAAVPAHSAPGRLDYPPQHWLVDDDSSGQIAALFPVIAFSPRTPTIGQDITLEVRMRPLPPEQQGSILPEGVLILPAGLIDLYCFIESDGLLIRGSEVVTVPIHPHTHEPATVDFELEARLQGPRPLHLEFFIEDPESGRISISKTEVQINVAPPTYERVLPRTLVLPRLDIPVAPRPELVLNVATTLPEGNDGPHLLDYRLSSHLPGLDLQDEEMGQVRLSPFDLARMRLLLIERLRAAVGLDPRDGRTLLLSLGRYLFDQLFPPAETGTLHDALRRAGEQLTHWLFVEAGTTWLPWELLVPPWHENRNTVDSPQFLAERYQLSRWIEGLGPPLYSEVPAGEVALLSYESSGSGLDEISAAWQRLLKVVPGTHGIADIFGADTPFFGLHILRYTDELMRKRDIVAREPATGVSSPEEEIRPARLDLRLRRPLVSLSLLRRRPADLDSSCTDWLLPERVIPFLRAGASAVVGPSWPTTEEADRAFFSTFYQLLDRRVPLGEAFRQSRLAVQRALPHHPDWLAYTLFGNPRARPYWPESSEGYTSLECLNPEQPLRAGKTYFFRASLRNRPPLSHRGRLVRAESLPNKVTAVFSAPGLLESIPEPVEMIPLGRTMVQATFVLTPKTEGSFPLLVYLFEGSERLHSLRLELEIERSEFGDTACMSWESSTSGMLVGSHEGRMERRKPITIIFQKGHQPVLVCPKEFSIGKYQPEDAEDLDRRLVELFEDIRIEVQGQGNELAAISEQYLAGLQKIGTQAFALLPPGLWDHLASLEKNARGRGISLDFALPAGSRLWEMVYTGDPADDEISPEKFWGFRYPIGHLCSGTEPQDLIHLNQGVFASSHDQLEYSNYELTRIEDKLREIEQRLRRRIVLRRLTDVRCSEDLLRLFEADDFLYGIVHFACHCTNPPEGASRAALELKVDDRELEISPGTFDSFANYKHSFRCQPLVFLNACQSATPLHLLQSLNFPSSLLSFGAGGVVATACSIPDNFASAFAIEFYSRLLDQLMKEDSAEASIGEALLETRLHFLKKYNNPLGLAYGHYAFSNQQLVVD